MGKKKKTHQELYEILYYGKRRKSTAHFSLFTGGFRLIIPSVVFLLLGGIVIFIYFARDLPDPKQLDALDVSQSTKIYDREGTLVLYDVYGETRRTVVPFNELSDYLKKATVAIEDDEFYSHPGVDVKAIARAFLHNVFNRNSIQGGSTLTQQFIKNAVLTPERTLTRKVKEVILAVELERRYSKDEILNFYLNQVPYGSVAYGAEAASQVYFGKHAKDLTLAESALLAALAKAPTFYSPYGSNPEKLLARKNLVLEKMFEFGYISQTEKEAAEREELHFEKNLQNIQAPHFVMYVREYLERTYGREILEKGGLKVYTTLDWDLQRLAEEAVATYRETNKKQFNASNAALVALDPKTGQILAMVGSVDYFDIENDGNVNVTIRERQPGSAFKPIVYAAAFEKGFTPKTVLFDAKTEFAESGSPSYQPQNYDGKFRGPVTMESALAQSLNIPAVKTLYLAGLPRTLELAKKMGVTTLTDPSRYGLSLVLGGGEVRLLELTSAFGALAADGLTRPPLPILRIETKDGKILEEFKKQEERVLREETARKITAILSDNALRTPMFGAKSSLYIEGYDVAVKTGTTEEYRDAWTVGSSPSLSVGVWAGNNDNSRMKNKADGSYVAAPIWNYFTSRALQKFPKETFTKPSSSEPARKPVLNGEFIVEKTISIDKTTGRRAAPATPPHLVVNKKIRVIHTILYWVNKDDPSGDYPPNPKTDPQFDNWEEGVVSWVKTSPWSAYLEGETIPFPDTGVEGKTPEITIIKPSLYETVTDPTFEIQLQVDAPRGVSQFDIFLDDTLLGSYSPKTADSSLYTYRVILPRSKKGGATLLVRVFDYAGDKAEDAVRITIPD